MPLDTDVQERSVSFSIAKKLYSKEGLQIAAHIFDSRAEVYVGESKSTHDLVLKAKRKTVAKDDLERLGGEFLNELLNHEYRFIVGRFNSKIASLIVTQAMFAARGGEEPPKAAPEEQTSEFKAEVQTLMREAQGEIERTMPKKIAPQGTVLPPAPEGLNG
ncbi:MAG: hypothetical protein HY077_16450 [Elusimicrobia bacterium]|nr:hypothetical protein [Elusimicrobiota bacterium]